VNADQKASIACALFFGILVIGAILEATVGLTIPRWLTVGFAIVLFSTKSSGTPCETVSTIATRSVKTRYPHDGLAPVGG